MNKLFTFILLITAFVSCSQSESHHDLETRLTEFVKDKDAEIGIAIIIDGKDTVSINGNKPFPMLSVYKFPIALALAEEYRAGNLDFAKTIPVTRDDLHPDTYSPMTEKILASDSAFTAPLVLSTRQILEYMLQQSDNNASDLALKTLKGPANAMTILGKIEEVRGINIASTEDEMHHDNTLCYKNTATPLAMARLLDTFDTRYHDPLSMEIKQIMESCATGEKRLPRPLTPVKAVIGHKTGTGFTLPDGTLMAVNDVAYVHLPDGHRYSIAVFIAHSGYSMEETENLIAQISEIVLSHIDKQ